MISYLVLKSKYLWIPLLLLYSILHLSKLELYPLCLFGMYSLTIEQGPKDYSIYTIEVDQKVLDYKKLRYKKFLILYNTLKKYDRIINNENIDPAASTLRKTMQRIPGKWLDKRLEGPYHYREAEVELIAWLHRLLDIPESSIITIKKQDYILTTDHNVSAIDSKIIAGE